MIISIIATSEPIVPIATVDLSDDRAGVIVESRLLADREADAAEICALRGWKVLSKGEHGNIPAFLRPLQGVRERTDLFYGNSCCR